MAGAVKATEEGFVLSDGTFARADVIVYCTGILGYVCCLDFVIS